MSSPSFPSGPSGLLLLGAFGVFTLTLETSAQAGDPPPFPASLSTVPVPLPDNLGDAVVDLAAAQRLGKAWFWDMAIGSDGMQACASCHFHAGADPRVKNQVSPGPSGSFGPTASGDASSGPNREPNAGDWPFRKLSDPQDNESAVLFDTTDRFTSMGIHARTFDGMTPGADADMGSVVPDADGFHVGGVNVRRVEPRNAPTIINAVFIDRLFWDGRADSTFNGGNPFGERDTTPHVLVKQPDGSVVPEVMQFNKAALASQAVGPPESDREMSFLGRTHADIGARVQSRQPLALQRVHANDSLLGPYSADPAPGLTALDGSPLTYADMIREAFDPKLWDSAATFGPDDKSQMEMNQALFFGLALLAYQSTLVSDQSPYDQWAEAGFPEDGGGILTAQELEGLDVFMNRGACAACHSGPEFAGAAISQLGVIDPVTGEREGLIERMAMADGHVEGGIVMRFGGEPQITYGPDGDMPDEEAPEEAETVFDLPIDPRGSLLEIRRPSLTGAPIAWGNIIGGGQGCNMRDVRGPLSPGSNAPDGSNFAAEWRFRVDDDCNMELRIDFEWEHPGLPEDDYWIVVAGFNIGQVHMGEVKPPAVYDAGFYNIGVRETTEDLGAGADGPFGPFSLARRASENGEDVDPGFMPPVVPGERTASRGAFRAMTIRNIELTGPYMHNGGFLTLEQVVDFYTGGAHFAVANIDDLDPEVGGIGGMDDERKAALVAFMKTLTDERVRYERAPFDHPELFYPDGSIGDENIVLDSDTDGEADTDVDSIPAVGAGGRLDPLLPFHEHELQPAFLVVMPQGGVVTSEAGDAEPQVIEVALAMPIEGEVRIDFSHSDAGQVLIDPPSLTFDSSDWFSLKPVTIRAVEDGLVDGDRIVSLSTVVMHTSDEAWLDAEPKDIFVQTRDSGRLFRRVEVEAESATRSGVLTEVTAAGASGGAFVHAPLGTGDAPAGFGGELTFDVTVEPGAEGTWSLWALGGAPSADADSFWVRVDDGPWTAWQVFRQRGFRWAWSAPATFEWSPGVHTLRIQHREDGAELDRVILTNEPGFMPDTGAPTERARRPVSTSPQDSGPAISRG